MKALIYEKIPKVIKNKKKLEKELETKIIIKEKEILIEGKPEDEYIAEKVIDALELDFPLSVALLIKEEDFMFEIINIKDYTQKRDFERIRARIIGRGGKALKTLSGLTSCYFEIKNNQVGIIGHPEHIQNAQNAIISMIRGSKHGNVYSNLEKHQVKKVFDLGLKNSKKGKQYL